MNNIISKENIVCLCFIIFFIFFYTITINGCASSEIVVDRYIPYHCDVTIPDLPTLDANEANNVRNLIIHNEQLECLIEYCSTGEFTEECKGE